MIISLEVGKTYITDTDMRVICLHQHKEYYLMVEENCKTFTTFWVDSFTGYGMSETFNDTKIIKEVPSQKTCTRFLNVCESIEGDLYLEACSWLTVKEAFASPVRNRVGIVPVTLINNLETGELVIEDEHTNCVQR